MAREHRRPSELEDPTLSSSQNQVVALFDSAARVLADPEVARRLGGEMLRQYRGTEIEQVMRSTGSTGALFRSCRGGLEPLVSRRRRSNCRRRQATTQSCARTHGGASPRPLSICDFTKGFLEEVPAVLRRRQGQCQETECQARGGRFCLYTVTWDRRASVTEPRSGQTDSADETHDDHVYANHVRVDDVRADDVRVDDVRVDDVRADDVRVMTSVPMTSVSMTSVSMTSVSMTSVRTKPVGTRPSWRPAR